MGFLTCLQSLGIGRWMRVNMKSILKKYWWAILGAGLLVLVLAAVSNFSTNNSAKLLSIESAESILTINKTSIYILNNKRIVKLPGASSGGVFSIIDSDVTYASVSSDKNKIYYTKGGGVASKSFIFDVLNGNIKEYQAYDEFFWKNSAGQFVKYQSGKSTILSESLAVEFSNLPYSGFISYAGVVLGSSGGESPETQGYRWVVVNKASASFSTLDILDYKDETAPWVSGDYLLYINNKDQTVVIDNANQRKTISQPILPSRITTAAGASQYFVSVDSKPGYINISSLNLAEGQVKLQKKVDVGGLLKKEGLSLENIKEVYFWDDSLYVLIGSKIMRITL